MPLSFRTTDPSGSKPGVSGKLETLVQQKGYALTPQQALALRGLDRVAPDQFESACAVVLDQITSSPSTTRALMQALSITTGRAGGNAALAFMDAHRAFANGSTAARTVAAGPAAAIGGHPLLTPGLGVTEQWLKWENELGFQQFRRPVQDCTISCALAPKESAELMTIPGADPAAVKALTTADGNYLWPRHPDNTSKEGVFKSTKFVVPHFGEPEVKQWKAAYTASRSTFFEDAATGFQATVKMPTDRPNYGASANPEKLDMTQELDLVMRNGTFVKEAEARAGGHHPQLIILCDVAALRDKATGNGITIRELGPIATDEDHYYMPGFGLPFLAKANGVSPLDASRLEAELSGTSTALFMLRYGKFHESPHGQNKLYQLDQDLKPTGTVLIRDMGDSTFVEPIARALGFGPDVDKALKIGDNVYESCPNLWTNTISGLDHTGYLNYTQLHGEKPSFEKAFCATVTKELGGRSSQFDHAAAGVVTMAQMDALLQSSAGVEALRAYGAAVLHNAVPGPA